MEVDETMQKNFLQFEPAPRRGEPEVCFHCRVLHMYILCSRLRCVIRIFQFF